MLSFMNKLPTEKRIAVISALIEGCSVNSTCRMTGVSKPAVLQLLLDVGEACAEEHDRIVRDVQAKRVQADELWAFVASKAKNTDEKARACGKGDSWLWLALDADSKLIISYLVGLRDGDCAAAFMADLASRLAGRVQLTSDGLKVYLDAVDQAFGGAVDFAQLVKEYTQAIEGQRRYSPAEFCCAHKTPITGAPEEKHISTSFVERVNLSVRMTNRRFTRLTNAFSKKLANHIASVHLNVFAVNFLKVNRSIKMTPAMASGVTSWQWTVADVVTVLDRWEERQAQAAAQEKAKAAKPSGLVPIKRRGGAAVVSGQTNQS